jgi:hypothetical protein
MDAIGQEHNPTPMRQDIVDGVKQLPRILGPCRIRGVHTEAER